MNTDIIEDLEIETAEQETSEIGDAEMGSSEDECCEVAWGDHLSEAIEARIRTKLPRGIQHVSPAGNGYLEALCERTEVSDGEIKTVVSVLLLDEALAARAEILEGDLENTATPTGEHLALGWKFEGTAFKYVITLDGKYIRTFDNLALARLTFEMLENRRPDTFHWIITNVKRLFDAESKDAQEDTQEHCSQEFAAWVNSTLFRTDHPGMVGFEFASTLFQFEMRKDSQSRT